MPTFDGSGNIINAEQDFIEIGNLSSVGGTPLLATYDVGAFRWVSVHLYGTYTGTVQFLCGNNSANLQPLYLQNISTAVSSSQTSAPGVYTGAINFRYLELTAVAFSSGTVQAVVELYYQPAPPFPWQVLACNSGGAITNVNGDQGGAVPQVSLYGKNATAGDTPLGLNADGSLKGLAVLPTIFQPLDHISLTVKSANTPTSIWTPASGKKFRLMGWSLAMSVAGNVYFHDLASVGGGGILPLIPPAVNANLLINSPALGNGYLSTTNNNQLWIDANVATQVTGFVFGREE